MKNLLYFRESEYFNDLELFVMYVPSLKRFWIVQATYYNGAWYGENYKLSSVLTCRVSELYHLEVNVNNVQGKIIKWMDNSLGILWRQGQKNTPYFWNDINKILKYD